MWGGWEEKVMSAQTGKRLLHYYLYPIINPVSDSDSDSDPDPDPDPDPGPILAVVGTERSLRHMLYIPSPSFVKRYGSRSNLSSHTKWHARSHLLLWLSSLFPPSPNPNSPTRKLKSQNSDLRWDGLGWTCSKKLVHYSSFTRNGVQIKVHSFVFITPQVGNPYLAYIEDMYEDRKTHKKVKLRWFNRAEDIVYHVNAHPREVFITPQLQVISAECIDGPASVVTPEHYDQCVAVLPSSILCRVHMCSRQLKNNMITPFAITKLQGYLNQPVLSCINHSLFSTKADVTESHKRKRVDGNCEDGNHLNGYQNELCTSEASTGTKDVSSYPKLKIRLCDRIPKHGKLEGSQPEVSMIFNVNDEIELLCQDSGIRGCWFRCKVLQVSSKSLKVEYDDVRDDENSDNLKEWVASHRVAAPDKFDMRHSGRLTVRPRPPEDAGECIRKVGAPVEVWWHDGWWEGVLTAINQFEADHLQIYLPGEDRFLTIEKSYVRNARDWVNGSWINAKIKPDIVSCISAKAKANHSISDHGLPPISELVEVNIYGEEPSSTGEDLAPVRQFCEEEHVVGRQVVGFLGCNVSSDSKDGLDIQNDYGCDSQQYDAPLKFVGVPVY